MFITEPHMAKIALISIAAFILLLAFINFLKDKQNAKNKAKQAPKETAEANKVLADVATGFLPRDCEEGCYQAFNKQMKEVFN